MIDNRDYQATQQQESRIKELHSRRGGIEVAPALTCGVWFEAEGNNELWKKD